MSNVINLFDKFKTEDDFEVNGIWKTYYGAAKIKLARAGSKNTAYGKCLHEIAVDLENTKETDSENETREERDRPWAELFAKTVIKGWKVKDGDKWVDGIHLPDDKGDIVIKPFNHKNTVDVLLALPDLLEILRKDANEIRTFQKAQEEKDVKN